MTRNEMMGAVYLAVFQADSATKGIGKAIDLVLEDAAKIADEVEKRDRQSSKEPCDMEERAAFQRGAFVSRNIAAAIRAMKEAP